MPAVLTWGVTHSLQKNGLTEINLKISEVGLSRSVIDRFEGTYQNPDTTLRVQLKQISVDYTLSQLVTGSAETLLVDSALLKLDHRASEQVSTSPALPSIELLLAAFNAVDSTSLPLNKLQLPNISITHNLASKSGTTFDTIGLSTEVTKHAGQLNAKLLIDDQQQLYWTNHQDNGWNVEYFDKPSQSFVAQQLEPSNELSSRLRVFKGSLKQVDRSLAFSADIKPQLAQRWLASIQQTGDPNGVSDITVTGVIKEHKSTAGLAVASTIELSSLGYQEWNFKSINGEFDVQISQMPAHQGQSPATRQINIESHTTVTLAAASSTDWQADDIALSLKSDVSLAQNMSKANSPEFQLSVGKLQYADQLELAETSFIGAVSATGNGEQWQLDVAEGSQLIGQYGRLDSTEFAKGWSLRSTKPLGLRSVDTLSFEQFALEKTLLEMVIPEVQDISSGLRVNPLNASLQLEQAGLNLNQFYATGSLVIPQFTIDTNAADPKQNSVWQVDRFDQTFNLSNDLLTSSGSVQNLERDLYIETNSEHDFKQRQGSSEFRFKTIKFSEPQRLAQIIEPIATPLTLVTGEVDLTGQARWRAEADQWHSIVDIEPQLKNLGGAYDGAYFSGANGQLALQVYPEIMSKTPHRLTVAHVDAGVANKDMVLEFKLRPSQFGDLPIIEILLAQTQLLQGSIALKPMSYDLNRSQQDLQVVVENIDLDELVTLQQLDDIQATGLVSGQLPMAIDNGQIRIDDGQLQAIAPGGVLRYQANADALQSNEYAETVVLALRNFHYDVLRADTQYQPDGTLLLKLQLQGNNPEFKQGQRVNLNINLEQNVLKLLESLRLYDGVNDKLDKQVQDYYQKTTSQ